MNAPDSAETITPVRFTPSGGPERHRGPTLLQLSGATVLAAVAFIFWFLFTSKSVQLDFHPAADEVAISGGPSFELGGVYLLREGEYLIEASTPQHEPLSATVRVGAPRNQKIPLSFTPLPGLVNVLVEPADAEVRIDGALIESQPASIAAGQHELSVSHPRYIAAAQIVEIEGKRIEQTFEVALAPNWAEVEITSQPAGAAIWLDGEDTDMKTPAVIEALAGERDILVQMTGFKAHRERIFAQAGMAMRLEPIRLVQADAQLTVTSAPSGAGVLVGGRFAGTTPIQLDLKSSTSHDIQVVLNGYQTYRHQARLQRGASAQLHAPLTRQTGQVVVQTLPANAVLHIDGKPAGSANQTLMLPVRPHVVEITLDGHAGYKQTITPKAGLTQEIKVRLLTFAEARLQALKPVLLTSAGQNIKLFDPYPFTMGASRREPGRRANETLRNVNLTRLFYLSTHEVTNAQFRQFASGHDSGSYDEASLNEDDQPVVNVSWHDAAAYCNWLARQDNLPPFYRLEFGKVVGINPTATGYRLPTEAEWAWAARTLGEDPGNEQLRFPWGANLPPPDRHGNYADRAASSTVGRIIFGYNDNYAITAPVGTFKADSRGLFDIGGNVAEWVNDFYEIPAGDDSTDPLGPSSGDYHVIRGASWMHGTITELRLSFRDYGIDGRQDVGFRIARFAE